MDNYQGDLTDIVRASGGGVSGDAAAAAEWQFPEAMSVDQGRTDILDNMFQIEHPIINIPPPLHGFGNPFSNMRDPLLHLPSCYAPNNNTSPLSDHHHHMNTTITSPPLLLGGGANNINNGILGPKIFEDDHVLVKPNRFSRMLQISTGGGGSPVVSPSGGGSKAAVGDSMINANSSQQISSPRNPGIKRRKSQAKKVVCIPAPASANSRPTGEVVPSDLWAWRKYGQKPIKGSPYPRGYYRCSSSKGCSARKQVERSRTDPNMLVITYTSEHNHPWPTQRNALAGSTRSQPSKNSNNNNSTLANSTTKPLKMGSTSSNKEEQAMSDQAASPSNMGSSSTTVVKEEIMEKQAPDQAEDVGFSYRPALPEIMSEQDSFFADLDEIEADPLHLLFTQGFSTSGSTHRDDHHHDHDKKDQGKGLDEEFGLFDWSEDHNNNKGL